MVEIASQSRQFAMTALVARDDNRFPQLPRHIHTSIPLPGIASSRQRRDSQ